jgi:glycosyltransferase involved in cell wall biosynthesis
VVWAGFIDKRRELARFLDTIADCDVGCLLSRAEAGGISLREFCRLGVPTIAPDVGGAPEYVLSRASDLVPPHAPDEVIASVITRLARDREELARRRRLAFERRHEASWDKAIDSIGRLVGRPSFSRQAPWPRIGVDFRLPAARRSD